MKISNASISNCEDLILNDERLNHKTNLSFLQEINGWRNGKSHLFVGMPGGGKSTLLRSLMWDYTINMSSEDRVFIYLSEESKLEYLTSLAYSGGHENAENIYISSEIASPDEDQIELDPDGWFDKFCEDVIKVNPTILFFDNLTTSDMYSDDMRTQNRMSFKLKSFCKKLDIPFVYFIHTHTNIKSGHSSIIDMNDIHGAKKIVKLTEFEYIMQNFNVGEKIVTTLRAVKHRGKNVETKMYLLQYDFKTFRYDKFVPIDFRDFKTLYTSANKLTGK